MSDEFTEEDWEHGGRFFRAEVRFDCYEYTVWAENEDRAVEKILEEASNHMCIPKLVSSKEEGSKEKTHWGDE